MRDNFKKAISFTLSWEGQYSNDPNDPGGETKWGISKRAYPDLDIASITREQAEMIYLKDYWIPTGCDNIQWPMDVIAFDTAVNQGKSVAVLFIHESYDPFDFLMKRIARYNDIAKNNPKFLRGWLNRVISLHKLIRRKDA